MKDDLDPRRLDPLSPHTRRVRRNMLGWSLLTLALGYANLVPTRIQALGIEIDHIDRHKLYVLLLAVMLFEYISFAIYGWIEIFAWMPPSHEMRELRQALARAQRDVGAADQDERVSRIESELASRAILEQTKHPLPRFAVDFLYPMFIGLIAVVYLANLVSGGPA